MDCLFNLQVPKSTEFVYIVRPQGKTYISGLARSYSMKYDGTLLKGYLSNEEFVYMISTFNDTLFQFWPCYACQTFSYMCCPFSLGLSCLLMNPCIADAEKSLRGSIAYFNKQKLKDKGIIVRLVKKCSTSWIEIQLKQREVSIDMAPISVSPLNISVASANTVKIAAKVKDY